MTLTAVIRFEDEVYLSHCPELDVASEGDSREAALENLREAVQLFLEFADRREIRQRLGDVVSVEAFEVAVG